MPFLVSCIGGSGGGGGINNNDGAAVYTMTNDVNNNEIVVFNRGDNGILTRAGSFSTEGQGEGRNLDASRLPFALNGASNPLILSQDEFRLFAVNTGSNTISSFRVERDNSLTFAGQQDSGGIRPISLAVRGDRLYVLNAGTQANDSNGVPGNIVGFEVDDDGSLNTLDNSTQDLTANAVDPSQIAVNDDGDTIVVTDKVSRAIITYPVENNDDVALPPNPSNPTTAVDVTPCGFDLTDSNVLIVSDANVVAGSGPIANGGALSSYILNNDNDTVTVSPVSGSVPTGGTASCWVGISNNERYVYTSNTFSGTITGYQIASDGSLTVLPNGGLTTVTTEQDPELLEIGIAGEFVYTFDATSGTIFAFRIEGDGSLTALDNNGNSGGLPNTAVGLAAY